MIAGMEEPRPEGRPLRRGWTTGACATAATRSALMALLGDGFEDPVTITLPGGQQPAFSLAHETQGEGFAEAGIIKDAGDDPDVTHGALVTARIEPALPGAGIVFRAGEGVGTVTRPGLPLAVGEPAINPVPRRMMREVIEAACAARNLPPDFQVTISVRNGRELAEKTWNPRLGILGGLSILGTTGIVVPYSCAAWIASIQRGVDVARAMGLTHLVGATGDTSEKAALRRLDEQRHLPLRFVLDRDHEVAMLTAEVAWLDDVVARLRADPEPWESDERVADDGRVADTVATAGAAVSTPAARVGAPAHPAT